MNTEVIDVLLSYLNANKEADCNLLIKTFSLNLYELAEIFPNLIIVENGRSLSLYGNDNILIYQEFKEKGIWHQYYYDFEMRQGYRMNNNYNFYQLLFREDLTLAGEVDYFVERVDVECNLKNPILLFYNII